MKDPNYGAPSHSVEGLEKTLYPPKNSGNDYVPDSTSIEPDHVKSQPRWSTHE